ncbi:MFS transporter [Saccharopolyspora erythraea]|uniref:MFS transporter n=1 Tax=Saccharopolyspora erythraea TaxID=1836 RepID=UPI001BA90E6A|nr:MFS transporter [Saccharopolyspora erythraea]QUH01403.1 MFS transporter [Saccharopolyspora erythraea]
MPLALWALTISAFGIGTTEFVIMGLLPEVAADFAVSIPTAGYLISGYALGVVVGAPLLTALGTRVPRKRMLLGLMVLFIAGNLLSALATSYGLLLTGRVVASFAHGAFFGIGAVVAADLVAPHKRAGAIAIMFTGLTAANVLGVPMGTWLGQSYGWRSTFVVVSVLGVMGLLGVATLVPPQPRPAATGVGRELASLRSLQVWLAVAMTVLGFGGVFAAFTYVAPMMTEVAGYTPAAVTWLLVLFGAGLFAGNLLGGRLADRALMPSLYGVLAALAVVLGLFTFTAMSKVSAAITLALVGAAGFATVPALQKRVMDKAEGAPTLASAVNIAAFNLGNALAAWLGGLVIEAGLGYTAPNWVGALMAAAALGIALFSGALDRRPARTAAAEPTPEPAAVR